MEMTVVTVIWNEGEKRVYGRPSSLQLLSERFTGPLVDKVVTLTCFLAGVMVIIGILVRMFPWYNIVLLFSVAAILYCYSKVGGFHRDPRKLGDLTVGSNSVFALLVAILYKWHPDFPMNNVKGLWLVEWIGLIALLVLLASKVGQVLFSAGVNPLRAGLGKTGRPKWVELVFFAGIGLWLGELLIYTVPWPTLKLWSIFHVQLVHSLFLNWIGAVLMLMGLAGLFWAYWAFGTAWRFGVDTQNPGALVTDGPFRFSRNPIYVAMELYIIGITLLYGTVVFFVFAAAGPVLVHYQILQEEEFLGRQYGAEYDAYRKRVARYFGHRPSMD